MPRHPQTEGNDLEPASIKPQSGPDGYKDLPAGAEQGIERVTYEESLTVSAGFQNAFTINEDDPDNNFDGSELIYELEWKPENKNNLDDTFFFYISSKGTEPVVQAINETSNEITINWKLIALRFE